MEKTRLVIYNTLTRRKETFRPLRKDWVGLYTCGPTVYNFVHIGNLRTYIFQDVLKRTLTLAGYRVHHIMNLTDVDDKTIRGAQIAGKTLKEFTRQYEHIFKEDLRKLNIVFPDRFTRATAHIPEMIALVASLLKKGVAYKKDGSVYFAISQFHNYGKLARLPKKGIKAGTRVDADEYQKNEAQDFVLWKAKKEGEPSWRSPYGPGRPGWHLECSAMSMKYLGSTFDFHTAAVDLIFPHHENEIAQSETATGKPFVRYWMHGEHLLINGEKMAKSLANIFTLRNLEEKSFDPLAFRYLTLTSHYRSKLNFTWESLAAATQSLEKIYAFTHALAAHRSPSRGQDALLHAYKKRFETAIYADLNTPRALAVLWDLIRQYHKNPAEFSTKDLLDLIYKFDSVLGLALKKIKKVAIPREILALATKREALRKKKQWQEADITRSEIQRHGYIVEDTPEGPKVKKG